MKVPHSTHGARHAPSPHRTKTQVRPVREPSSGAPRTRTEHRGHRTGLSQHPLARGCRPRGCRAPARRVHGRRVRYVIGDEPGQVNGMRWRQRVSPAVG
ncbi:tryptophan biosynthesis modulator TrpM [Streptomyces sp. NPDC057621]|uniref:tryptophan biosynthesis modulator TrpM n=1 Tax=Streptomyces TaxID=1883 RepID=UPI0036A5F434